jgi:hypothetical protein
MTITYESGATSHGANNLILSVLNDGAIYEALKRSGFAMLQGIYPALGFKELINNEVIKQRAEGSKFSARDIKEARELIIKDTIKHCLELIKDAYTGDPIKAVCRRWWDKVNGNSYFSVHVTIGKYAIILPFQYGYDNHYQSETEAQLKLLGISAANVTYTDQGFKLKRDMFNGLYISKLTLA